MAFDSCYKCDSCGAGIQEDGWAHEGINEEGELVHICCDCWNTMPEWAKNSIYEVLNAIDATADREYKDLRRLRDGVWILYNHDDCPALSRHDSLVSASKEVRDFYDDCASKNGRFDLLEAYENGNRVIPVLNINVDWR